MGLKQDVVIVSEFSVPEPGGKGSRGGTPGSYVERYMAREQATESLAPIQRARTDDFILRYMARESAVEVAPTKAAAKAQMAQAQGQGGVAFGYGEVSLSDQQLKAASKDIQGWFDKGHTVLKTVISFDQDYLRDRGIVNPDFKIERRGDYRGHIDQMKLRMAIMHGLNRMGTEFDDLRYVGVIQVDTEHVHCHLAMVDAGRGVVMPDGTQKGKLTSRQLSRLRRGTHAWLDEKRAAAQLSSAVGYERRNVVTFIKRWAHERMQSESLTQFLLACLPARRDLWRAGSNHSAMRKPNQIVREMVIEHLERAGSPMPAAMEQIRAYADTRREVEGLGAEDWGRLVEQGREQIIERAVNAVYQMLRALPPNELWVRTPMLDVMGMDYEQLALAAAEARSEGRAAAAGPATTMNDGEDLVTFGFRLRSYASRLDHHTRRRVVYRDLAQKWEALAQMVTPEEIAASRPMYDFYISEAEFHARAISKYRHFLPFVGDQSHWYAHQQEVAAYGQQMLSLIALRNDASLQRMKDAEQAEQMGRDIYNQPGGALLTQGSAGRLVLDGRIEQMRTNYAKRLDDLREELADAGLLLVIEPSQTPDSNAPGETPAPDALEAMAAAEMRLTPGIAHPFSEVKAVDLHHLGYDFARDIEISNRSRQTFIATTQRRREALSKAIEYLEQTGQSEAINDLPVDDVVEMVRLAEQLAAAADQVDGQGSSPVRRNVLPSKIAELQRRVGEVEDSAAGSVQERSPATALDAGLSVRVRQQVDATVLAASMAPARLVEPPVEVGPEGR